MTREDGSRGQTAFISAWRSLLGHRTAQAGAGRCRLLFYHTGIMGVDEVGLLIQNLK